MRALLLALFLFPSLAWAQASAPSACGPASVGTGAAAMTFPASGATGPRAPTQYLQVANPSPTNYLCVNAQPGGTAAVSGSGCAAGSIYVAPLAMLTWWQPAYPPPAAVSVVASGASTPMTCNYK